MAIRFTWNNELWSFEQWRQIDTVNSGWWFGKSLTTVSIFHDRAIFGLVLLGHFITISRRQILNGKDEEWVFRICGDMAVEPVAENFYVSHSVVTLRFSDRFETFP